MAFKKLMMIGLCLSLGACAFKKDNNDDNKANSGKPTDVIGELQKEQEKQSFEGALTESNVLVSFDELEKPGLYKMRIQWPKGVKKLSLSIDSSNPRILSNVGFYEMTVGQGETVKILLASSDQFGSPISNLELTKTAPRDYIVSDKVHLSKNLSDRINRLYFLKDSQILTHGYSLSLVAKKLFIEKNPDDNYLAAWSKAQILTERPETTAQEDRALAGSNISIQVEQAVGSLRIALIGTNSMDGRSGDELDRLSGNFAQRALNGQNGSKATSKLIGAPCIRTKNNDAPCDREILACDKPATNGTDGLAGATGTAGEDSATGGNTGSLFFVIKDDSHFSLETLQQPGSAGKPGKGARGHEGGLGGQAGDKGLCPTSAQNGNPGARGADGPDGQQGRLGPLGTIQVIGVGNYKAL